MKGTTDVECNIDVNGKMVNGITKTKDGLDLLVVDTMGQGIH